MADKVIFAEQTVGDFYLNSDFGLYAASHPGLFEIAVGKTYRVVWDGYEFTCTAQDASSVQEGAILLGSGSLLGLEGSEFPFIITYSGVYGVNQFYAVDGSTSDSHTVAIYEVDSSGDDPGTDETYADNVVSILNYSQNPVTYENVPKIWLTHPSSTAENPVRVPFTYGEAVSKTVQPNFATGDMAVPIADGELVTELTIAKPADLKPENIAEGEYIAGVGPGTHSGGGAGISKRVELDFRDCLVVDSSEVMTRILGNPDNVGLYIKYTGESGEYTQGQYYRMVDEYGALVHTPSAAVEVASNTTLTATVTCKVGDLIIAAFVVRSDLVSLNDGWTLISTSQDVYEINAAANIHQTLSFAYKYAAGTTESITVTQTSAARIYISMIAVRAAISFTDGGYQYQSITTASSPFTMACDRPTNKLVLWAAMCIYSTGIQTVSNASRLILSTASGSRLVLAVDVSGEETTDFANSGSTVGDVYVCGAISVEVEPGLSMIEVGADDVPMLEEQIVREYGDVPMSQVTVTKPESLAPENIKKDVNIGGIVGTLGSDIISFSKVITSYSYGPTSVSLATASELAKAGIDLTPYLTWHASGNRYIPYITLTRIQYGGTLQTSTYRAVVNAYLTNVPISRYTVSNTSRAYNGYVQYCETTGLGTNTAACGTMLDSEGTNCMSYLGSRTVNQFLYVDSAGNVYISLYGTSSVRYQLYGRYILTVSLVPTS